MNEVEILQLKSRLRAAEIRIRMYQKFFCEQRKNLLNFQAMNENPETAIAINACLSELQGIMKYDPNRSNSGYNENRVEPAEKKTKSEKKQKFFDSAGPSTTHGSEGPQRL